ncbi:magnesium chelatase ATPase subunit I [Ahrensia sp. R2A130]|uniref:magnesium chelatase ATPase subunit I n=1 Tax=Ahrensia sp. R2A130 TaxID=744979 RepID=UPI0001E08406|nr:magnesium chelatase ATPase subunit I [Ahrensia sp. R2A130]EFL89060.1 magnesium chelatase ATPase subunit I [Ahrensia sp. R2A130]
MSAAAATAKRIAYPFSAIVGQDSLKHALLLSAVDPSLGGVLALGDRGTGKTTAVRGLANLLPPIKAVKDCHYHCDPAVTDALCEICAANADLAKQGTRTVAVPVVDLPLGATEDRVLGALDIERALVDGEKQFEPGLLADANRGYLYIDEVNLLEDHLVDVLLDVAASGSNVVEREGLSLRHPARFVLVGSGNPEEGELRPQLLDRFGLSVDVETPKDPAQRVEIIKRREAFDADRAAFAKRWASADAKNRKRILTAREKLPNLDVPDATLLLIAEICIALGTDGLRGELTLIKAARAHAALEGATSVEPSHVRAMAPLALGHRLRRNPLDDARATVRVERILDDIFAAREAA